MIDWISSLAWWIRTWSESWCSEESANNSFNDEILYWIYEWMKMDLSTEVGRLGVVESRWDVTGILFESTCDWLSIETVRSSPRDLWGSHSLISYGGFRSTNPQFLFKTRLHSLINEFTRSEFENRSWYSSQLFTIIFKSVSSNMDTCFWIDSNASDCSEGEKEIIDGTLRKRAC